MRPTATLAALLISAAPAAAEPTVVELFTSQSCYSCPPAEAYLGELAERADVVALEWHVDYWDNLIYGFAGRWQDVFSDPAHTERQRVYNLQIRGIANVYTPQMVIDGRLEAVGSRTGEVDAAIAEAGRTADQASLSVARAADAFIAVAVDGRTDAPASVWLVHLLDHRVTEVEGGENNGRTLTNHNVVVGAERLGPWSGGTAEFTAALPSGTADRCAVLVQADGQGPILAAAYCPG